MIERFLYLAIRSIIYAILYTRPNISYILSITSKHQYNLGESHWKIVKKILKYLRRTKNVSLVYEGHELEVHGYLDVSFQSDIKDRKSQSGYVFSLNRVL
jgi:hypothetical protein